MKNPVGYNKKSGKYVKCIVCGFEKYRPPSALHYAKFCSRSCSSKFTKNGKFSKGIKRPFHTEETKEKIRIKHLNKVISQETRNKISVSHSGENGPHWREKNHKWISDRSKLKKYIGSEERRSPMYKQWRKEVCDRDNWKCKINNEECCGKLEVHHILGFTEFPELKYKINNGIALCHAHHPRKRSEEKRLVPTFQELVLMSVSKD